ncbi:MAG: hypothetical protein IPF44_11340 [Betaproteobacteria bacterium]|nr:hypothetical protein [Betaproteobacteria bacterium]
MLGCGANQTVDQIGLSAHVRASHALGTPHEDFDPDYLHRLAARVCEQATWLFLGPVHINQPFREPLLRWRIPLKQKYRNPIRVACPVLKPAQEDIRDIANRISGRPGVVVCVEMSAYRENNRMPLPP